MSAGGSRDFPSHNTLPPAGTPVLQRVPPAHSAPGFHPESIDYIVTNVLHQPPDSILAQVLDYEDIRSYDELTDLTVYEVPMLQYAVFVSDHEDGAVEQVELHPIPRHPRTLLQLFLAYCRYRCIIHSDPVTTDNCIAIDPDDFLDFRQSEFKHQFLLSLDTLTVTNPPSTRPSHRSTTGIHTNIDKVNYTNSLSSSVSVIDHTGATNLGSLSTGPSTTSDAPTAHPTATTDGEPPVGLLSPSQDSSMGRDFDTLHPELDETPPDESSPIDDGKPLPADGDTVHSANKLTDSTASDNNKPADSPLPSLLDERPEKPATGDADHPIPTDISYPTADNSSNTKHSNVIQDCYVRTTLDSIEYCDEPDRRTCHHPSDAIESITFETGLGTPSKLKAYCLPPTTPDTILTSQEASMGSEQEATLLPRREVGLSGVVSTLFDNPQALEPHATATSSQRDVRTTRRRAQRHRTNARRRKRKSRRRKRKSHEDEQRPKRVCRKSRKDQHRSRQTGVSTQVDSVQVNNILKRPTYLDITTGLHCLGDKTVQQRSSNDTMRTSYGELHQLAPQKPLELHQSHILGVTNDNQLSHISDEQPNSTDLTMETDAMIDEYKSNSFFYFTSVESILDTTIESIETIDGTIADSAASKAQTSPDSTTSPHIGPNIVNSFDTDQSYVDTNFVADSEINGLSSDSTTIEEVDVYKIIDSFATLMESKLDEMFDFMETFDSAPTSHRTHHGDHPPTALKLQSLERDIVDPLLIDSIHVTPDLSPSFKAPEARNHPSIALALPSDPYWKPSEKDGERPQKDREKDGEWSHTWSHTYSSHRSNCDTNQPMWRNALETDTRSVANPRARDWERCHRLSTWLPKLVIQDSNNYSDTIIVRPDDYYIYKLYDAPSTHHVKRAHQMPDTLLFHIDDFNTFVNSSNNN